MSIWVKTIYIFVAFILYVICKIKTFNFNCDSQPSLRNVLNTFLKFWLNSALVLTKTQFVSSPPKTSALLNFGPFPPLLRPPWGRTQTHATPRPRVPLHWYPISAQSRSDIEEGWYDVTVCFSAMMVFQWIPNLVPKKELHRFGDTFLYQKGVSMIVVTDTWTKKTSTKQLD